MARPFSSSEAKRITEEHITLLKGLKAVDREYKALRVQVEEAADSMVSEEALRLLRDIPIEEINRDKRGFRVKTLRENGYETIADIAGASRYQIAAVNGIGDDSAFSIRRVVDEIVETTRKSVRIRLSTDNKTIAATALITAVSKYAACKDVAASCMPLRNIGKGRLEQAAEDLKPAKNGFSWFFASSEKKRKAENAYTTLQDAIKGDYGEKAREQLRLFEYEQSITEEKAWEDFTHNSVRFFNIIEGLCPGVLGGSDGVYGLPDEIALKVQEQEFFPDGLLCELRHYQEWGVKYVLRQERVLLGDEMGLGKTVQAIAAMVSLRNTGATHFMVVCPASVLPNWCREIKKMSRLTAIKLHGPGRSAAVRSWIKSGGVGVTTYETTGQLRLPEDFRFSVLVVDEAHYIKNPETQRSFNVRELCFHTERLLFMTGTALENRVDEMITLIRILRPELAEKIQNMAYLSSAPQFREAVAPVYYRRKREDVLAELPELIESREWCSLGLKEELAYESAVLSRNYAEARRVSWNVDDMRNSSKARRLVELVEEAESEGRKVIVFSFFLDTIRKVTELLGARCMNPINGSVSPARRQEIVDEFNAAPAGSVLAAQIQSGGTGLNIQGASVVIFCEPQFKPSVENQAISRAYRMGQTRNVLVYRLLCENTVDERLVEILEEKQEIFDAFADSSVAAGESRAIDERSFDDIIQAEIERINAKHGKKPPEDDNDEV